MFEFAMENLLSGAESLNLGKGLLGAEFAAAAMSAQLNPFALYGATAFNGFLDLGMGLPSLPDGYPAAANSGALPDMPSYQPLPVSMPQLDTAEFRDLENFLDMDVSSQCTSPESGSSPSSVPGSPHNSFLPNTVSTQSLQSRRSSGTGDEQQKRKRRRPKPRMCELPPDEAQAKRESNRESARKCRERKRERDLMALGEGEAVRKELQELRARVQLLTGMVLERDATIAALTAQPMGKRMRLDMASLPGIAVSQ